MRDAAAAAALGRTPTLTGLLWPLWPRMWCTQDLDKRLVAAAADLDAALAPLATRTIPLEVRAALAAPAPAAAEAATVAQQAPTAGAPAPLEAPVTPAPPPPPDDVAPPTLLSYVDLDSIAALKESTAQELAALKARR